MTRRVHECQRRLIITDPRPALRRNPHAPARGFRQATLAALLLVPLAGAAEPPQGWAVGTVAALAVLMLVPGAGGRIPWGWLMLVLGSVALVAPRGPMAVMGPALFVACGLSFVLWLANRSRPHAEAERRPGPGSREREAQQSLGAFGERHVGETLARGLPDEFVVINGLKLLRGAGDIDHLVVGPTGVFVLES